MKKKRRRTAIDEECNEGDCVANASFSTWRLQFAVSEPLGADLHSQLNKGSKYKRKLLAYLFLLPIGLRVKIVPIVTLRIKRTNNI